MTSHVTKRIPFDASVAQTYPRHARSPTNPDGCLVPQTVGVLQGALSPTTPLSKRLDRSEPSGRHRQTTEVANRIELAVVAHGEPEHLARVRVERVEEATVG